MEHNTCKLSIFSARVTKLDNVEKLSGSVMRAVGVDMDAQSFQPMVTCRKKTIATTNYKFYGLK
jgi:hypothetical protein